MLMNQQSVSVHCTPFFSQYLKDLLGSSSQIKLHASNVYLFNLPPAGEIQTLDEHQKKFIFKEELSLYEEQFEIQVAYSPDLFDKFFTISWHGVNYHIDIDKF